MLGPCPGGCARERGGLASAVNEIAEAGGLGIALDESAIPVEEEVRGACEILGFDPLYVANEGRFIAFVPEKEAEPPECHIADPFPSGPISRT